MRAMVMAAATAALVVAGCGDTPERKQAKIAEQIEAIQELQALCDEPWAEFHALALRAADGDAQALRQARRMNGRWSDRCEDRSNDLPEIGDWAADRDTAVEAISRWKTAAMLSYWTANAWNERARARESVSTEEVRQDLEGVAAARERLNAEGDRLMVEALQGTGLTAPVRSGS